ncbi:MAG: undecaprenyl-diphosphatase [Thermoplasmata archaeon]|nr:undecaprenyl-diphosphatase [Thermoplasmata archaeon]
MELSAVNTEWFNAINSLAGKNPYLDGVMIFLAQFLIFIVPIYLLFLWFRGDKKFTIFLLLGVLLSLALSMMIGKIYYHPRPFVLNLTTPLISHSPDSSFPSDHAVVMLSFTFPFFFFKKYKSGTIFLLLSILVGLGRIYCGLHFPLDIIGSFFLSLIVTYILFVFRREIFTTVSKFIRESKKQ